MLTAVLVLLAGALIFTMSSGGEKTRAVLLSLVVLLLSTASVGQSVRNALVQVLSGFGGHL